MPTPTLLANSLGIGMRMKKSTNIIAELITDFLDWYNDDGHNIVIFVILCLCFGWAFCDRLAHPTEVNPDDRTPEYYP
jgi:hypothetical protein